MDTLPYVVSGDINLLLHEWAGQRNFQIPGAPFFTTIRQEFNACLGKIFPVYEFVWEGELKSGIAKLVHNGGLPTISMDRVYHRSPYSLEVTRTASTPGEEPKNKPRPGSPPLAEQIAAIVRAGHKKMAIVDDVIYTGGCIDDICESLRQAGIDIPVVYAGIGVGRGISRVTKNSRKVECVRRYKEVIDEVCERDFYPGIPLGGRTLEGDGNTGAPYIRPFGKMNEWASIPEIHQEKLSDLCIRLTCRIFTEIERMNATIIRCCDLDRKITSLPTDDTRFVDALSEVNDFAHA